MPKNKFYFFEPGFYTVDVPYEISLIKATVVAGGGGGSSLNRAADGENTTLRWFGGFIIAHGGTGGSITVDCIKNENEYTYHSYAIAGKYGLPMGKNGLSKSLTNFSSNPQKIIIPGGKGYNLGTGIYYGSGGDVNITCDPYINYHMASGGSGGYTFTKIKLDTARQIYLFIGKGGKGSGYGSDGACGAVLLEYEKDDKI